MADTKANSILIVDDDKSNLLILIDILGPVYTLYMARSGPEALERANSNTPDLILLDIVMPGMDGYEVLAELRKPEKTRDIPVIFITGLNGSGDEEKGLALGAADYISKPFSPSIVLLRVQNQIKLINQTRLIVAKELAEKSSRAKSEFLSRMSHDMRTPMNAVINMISMAYGAHDIQKKDEYLIKAGGASRGLMCLINDALDMSDIEDGKLRLVNAEFDLSGMLYALTGCMKLFFEEKRQTLEIEIDPSAPGRVLCDEKRLSQCITNILMNACKYTAERGRIKLKVSAEDGADAGAGDGTGSEGVGADGDTDVSAGVGAAGTGGEGADAPDGVTIRIDVSDNGAGIAKEQYEKIMGVFGRNGGAYGGKQSGVGPGLYITKKIIELMGGRIWAETKPGAGSVFSFTFRALLPAQAEEPGSLAGKTALLADDIDINREIILATLEDTQMEFICAANGLEAVELYESGADRIDVVLMDINMPVMDGVEASRRIRSLETARADPAPIIAITANSARDELNEYFSAGISDHVGKPIDKNELVMKIKKHIR